MRKPMSAETKKKISDAKKGRRMSEETKERIRQSHSRLCAEGSIELSDAQRLRNRKADVKRKYGLAWEEYQALVAEHNNVCAICNNPETSISKFGTVKSLTVDHCHKTNRIRGLLCDACNRGIGHLRDDISILQRAIDYLKRQ